MLENNKNYNWILLRGTEFGVAGLYIVSDYVNLTGTAYVDVCRWEYYSCIILIEKEEVDESIVNTNLLIFFLRLTNEDLLEFLTFTLWKLDSNQDQEKRNPTYCPLEKLNLWAIIGMP